jgi:dTDP-4-dehydrorhamnose 3,5-epimerase
MQVLDTDLADVKLIKPAVFGDDRGFFLESWNARVFAEAGINYSFVQQNHSKSAKGVLRGLHYQMPQPQGKLVRVVAGAVYDVALDLRRSSPTFGRWAGFTLSAENKDILWVPPGFAHGFLSLHDGTEFLYSCTDFYAPEYDHTVLWNDPALAIDWPLDDIGQPTLSAKDVAGTLFAGTEPFA